MAHPTDINGKTGELPPVAEPSGASLEGVAFKVASSTGTPFVRITIEAAVTPDAHLVASLIGQPVKVLISPLQVPLPEETPAHEAPGAAA